MTRRIFKIVFTDGTAARCLGDEHTEPAMIAAKLTKPIRKIECEGVTVWPANEAMKGRIRRAQESFIRGQAND